MQHRLFTVYDAKAEMYLLPFTDKTIASAIRTFTETCTSMEHQFHKHCEDFTLFELGSYDDNNASYELLATPHALIKAIEVASKKENNPL